jgi:hypothetical protein
MGMYNEVYCLCKCGFNVSTQIPQVVLGFGRFHLNNPDSLSALSQEEKEELAKYVNNEDFCCGRCKISFKIKVTVTESDREFFI